MSDTQHLGLKGEELAAGYLEKKGYRILFRNWKYGRHEIDIIAEDKESIIFVEVKTRAEDFRLHPSKAVTSEKQRAVIFAADAYMQRSKTEKESRFDIISIIKKDDSFDIEHIERAFYPTLR
jgi:putative endonuclease